MRLNIVNSFGERSANVADYERSIQMCNNDKYNFASINHRERLGISRAWLPHELDALYRNRDSKLLRFYDWVRNQCKNAHVFIVSHENVYHPEFVYELSKDIYTVLYTGDDPEGSYLCSQPYAWAFDHTLCYAVFYDERTLMVDKLRQWGSRRVNHKPHGFHMHKCDGNISEDDLFAVNRDIDILYVGGAYNKVSDLLKVKKAFGRRFKLYGDWGGLGPTLGLYRRYGFFSPVRPLPESEFVRTYQRSAIGLNMHMSYGPSNLRMWDLPINGVMQITDNPIGTSMLFEVGKEICCYENGRIDQAIDIIDYYLSNDKERLEIARQGYRRAKTAYSFQQTFWDVMPTIEQGIIEKQEGI